MTSEYRKKQMRAYTKAWSRRPEVRARLREYYGRPEVKARKRMRYWANKPTIPDEMLSPRVKRLLAAALEATSGEADAPKETKA